MPARCNEEGRTDEYWYTAEVTHCKHGLLGMTLCDV